MNAPKYAGAIVYIPIFVYSFRVPVPGLCKLWMSCRIERLYLAYIIRISVQTIRMDGGWCGRQSIVYIMMSSLMTCRFYPFITGSVYSCVISAPLGADRPCCYFELILYNIVISVLPDNNFYLSQVKHTRVSSLHYQSLNYTQVW